MTKPNMSKKQLNQLAEVNSAEHNSNNESLDELNTMDATWTESNDIEDNTDTSAYMTLLRLKETVRLQFIDLYCTNILLPKEEQCTMIEIGLKINRTPKTMWMWLQESLVQAAITEISDPIFKFNLKQLVKQHLVHEMNGGKPRHEIVDLSAKISGLLDESININMNFNTTTKSPNLRNRFKK
jgi:hypothetical protein